MKTTREEFLMIVASSQSNAAAARKLGISEQSVRVRLGRIKLRPLGKQGPTLRRTLTNQQLEAAWHEALEQCDLVAADDLFGEMCERTAAGDRSER
jgi:hypothetical protein